MTNWSFDPENDSGTLVVEGDVTVSHVTELKGCLLEAFAKAANVTVDVSAVTAVDVAGAQLLSAGHRFAAGRGLKMCLRYGDNQRFLAFLDEVGFARDFICNHGNADKCLWT